MGNTYLEPTTSRPLAASLISLPLALRLVSDSPLGIFTVIHVVFTSSIIARLLILVYAGFEFLFFAYACVNF